MTKFEKNPKLKENFDVISEGVINAILSFIPAGPLLSGFLNYRNNLKQKRILDFSESVKKALEEIDGKELHASNFETEDFVDVIEAVYMRVINTRSVYKLERFRNIIVNQIIEQRIETPMFNKYIQLLDQLDDAQIVILDTFRNWEGKKIISIAVAYLGNEHVIFPGAHVLEQLSKKLERNVTLSEAEYYMNELVSLGLIQNITISITAVGKNSPHNNYQISSIGKSFLKFIESNGV